MVKVIIYETDDGHPRVTVEGYDMDSPEDIAKTYKKVWKELNKEEEE